MREIKYIVPPGLEGVKVSDEVVNFIKKDCAERSAYTKVVLLGVFDGLTCLALRGGNLPKYARSAVVYTVDKFGNIGDLSPLPSMRIIDMAIKRGVSEILLSND